VRILHLLASPVFSGPAENVAWLADGQRALGHTVRIAVDRKRGRLGSEEASVPRLRALGLLDEEGRLELSPKSDLWSIARDVSRLKKQEVEVVHAHFTHDHFIARFGRPKGAVLVRSVHAPRSLRRSIPGADAYTLPPGVSAKVLEGRVCRPLWPLLDPSFVPHRDPAALRRELGLSGAPLVGMVSTFQASRRHAVAIDAFARLRAVRPDARLLLVGDGALESELRARVRRAGLGPFVTFVGYREGRDFVRLVQALDQLWVLGLGNDWSARPAAQGRACGVTVLGVAEGALPELVDQLVAPDPEKLAEAAQAPARREVALPGRIEIAEQVVALYRELGAKG
jgi:glycosyltransferase involved in cell wall biosynthesis